MTDSDDILENLPSTTMAREKVIYEIDDDMHERELFDRRMKASQLFPFGINVLDVMTSGGMEPGELVLISGKSANGKTELMTNIFQSCCENKKRALYVGLEAKEFDIYRKLKFKAICVSRNQDPDRGEFAPDPTQWGRGLRIDLDKYEDQATERMRVFEEYGHFRPSDKGELFSVDQILAELEKVKDQFDIFLIDHFHMLSFGEKEYQEQSMAIKRIRQFGLRIKKPIVMACHLRKSESKSATLIPDRSEIMGSSDLAKVATMIIFVEKNNELKAKIPTNHVIGFEKTATLFRLDKFRDGGSREMFVPLVLFDSTEGRYDNSFYLGQLNSSDTEWTMTPDKYLPIWSKPHNKEYLRDFNSEEDIPF